MSIKEILFVSTWFGVGFIIMIALWVYDMRNKEFDENYFDMTTILISLLVMMLGYISLFVSIGIYCYTHRFFTRLIYKIANIGVKEPEKNSKGEDHVVQI